MMMTSPPYLTTPAWGLAGPEAWPGREHRVSQWQTLLTRFEPISLAQMDDDLALLNRTDTKYVLDAAQLYCALAALGPQYRILEVAGVRLNRYRTLYFDTADLALYRRHQAGGRNCYKVRSRQYVGSRLSFLEVKRKVDESRTIKNRVQTPGLVTGLDTETADFLAAWFPFPEIAPLLQPILWNDFYRITLVSVRQPERLTLDLRLRFEGNRRQVTLPGVVVAEVKQAKSGRQSDFAAQMRALNLRPDGFSKYCVGVSLLYPALKHNRFKPKLQLLNKLMKGTDYVYGTH